MGRYKNRKSTKNEQRMTGLKAPRGDQGSNKAPLDSHPQVQERPSKRAKTSHVPSEGPSRRPAQGMDGAPKTETQERPSKRAKTRHPTTDGAMRQPVQASDDVPNSAGSKGAKDVTDDLTGLSSDPEVLKTHRVVEFSVTTSSEMTKKVTRLLSLLATINFTDRNCKPVMALVRADGPAAGKAISVVEIAKAELERQNTRWYQYSTVSSHTKLIPRGTTTKGAQGGRTIAEWQQRSGPKAEKRNASPEVRGDGADECVDGDENSFERVETRPRFKPGDETATHKTQAMPRILIYVSRMRCDHLKTLYG